MTNNPKDWQTRRERAVHLLRVADDIEWDSYGKRNVQHLRSRAKDLLDTDPNEKEPPFKRKNAMTDGIYACLWIIKEQRALPNHEGVNSPTALAIVDAYAAVENWLAQQKEEAKKLEEAATCETFPFKQTL